MSLILDALKKSEAERQRHVGPTLLDVRVARPQRRYPIWAFVLGALLLVNLVLLLVFVVRRPAADATAPITATAAATSPSALAPVARPAPASAPVSAPSAPLDSAAASAQPATTSMPPTLADDDADNPSTNPADTEPALPPSPNVGGGSVKYQRDDSGGYASLPSYGELSGSLPPLRLDLHVYAERPHDRYAMINMQGVHEGDTLSEGMRVLAITRDGVALDYRGQQFVLHPQ